MILLGSAVSRKVVGFSAQISIEFTAFQGGTSRNIVECDTGQRGYIVDFRESTNWQLKEVAPILTCK